MVGAETITHEQQKRTMKDIFICVDIHMKIYTPMIILKRVYYMCLRQMAGIGGNAGEIKGKEESNTLF